MKPTEPVTGAVMEKVHHAIETGMPPDQLADHVFRAILEERLYILTYPEFGEAVRTRFENILSGSNPVLQSS